MLSAPTLNPDEFISNNLSVSVCIPTLLLDSKYGFRETPLVTLLFALPVLVPSVDQVAKVLPSVYLPPAPPEPPEDP